MARSSRRQGWQTGSLPLRILVLMCAVLGASQGVLGDEEYYRVRPGDTLRRIAYDRLGDAELWPAIYRANNHLRSPDHLQAGTMIVIPDEDQARREAGMPRRRIWPLRILERFAPLGLPLLAFVFVHVLLQGCVLWMGGTLCRVPSATFPNALRATLFTDLILLILGSAGVFVALNIAKTNPETATSIPTVDGILEQVKAWVLNPSAPLSVLAGVPLLYSICGYFMVRRVFGITPGRASFVTGLAMFLPLFGLIMLASSGSLRIT